jgi:hypothetical protein
VNAAQIVPAKPSGATSARAGARQRRHQGFCAAGTLHTTGNPERQEPNMRACLRPFVTAAAVFVSLPASAESLRCSGGLVAEGDSRLSVAFKCGQPLLADSFCAPVYYNHTLRPVPEPFASAFVPCQQTDEWLYDRGPGHLMATVRFRAGTVQSITYGRTPR